jgi:hypothetical protein
MMFTLLTYLMDVQWRIGSIHALSERGPGFDSPQNGICFGNFHIPSFKQQT